MCGEIGLQEALTTAPQAEHWRIFFFMTKSHPKMPETKEAIPKMIANPGTITSEWLLFEAESRAEALR
jgi:hypothetical protein